MGGLAVAAMGCSTDASHGRAVRFWQGIAHASVGADDHLTFIRTTLAPTTVLAGEGALVAYTLYIPPSVPLPEEAELSRLPFTEAAILIYSSSEAFEYVRAIRPEYSPIHFLKDGFDESSSCTATPQPRGGASVKAARCQPREDRLAYDIAPRTGAPDWRAGAVLAWLVLKKKGVPEQRFLGGLGRQFDAFAAEWAAGSAAAIDGHYVRVGEAHAIHFVHLAHDADLERGKRLLLTSHERFMADLAVSFDLAASTRLVPFGPGWTAGVRPGAVVSVAFGG